MKGERPSRDGSAANPLRTLLPIPPNETNRLAELAE